MLIRANRMAVENGGAIDETEMRGFIYVMK